MSRHERFRLSHLMPNSWFYKLRDMKRPRLSVSHSNTIATAAGSSRRSSSSSSHYCHFHGTTTPKPLPLSPHRSYYCSYLQEKQMPIMISPDLLQRSAASVVAVSGDVDDDDFQDLRLRPIRTRPASAASDVVEPRTTATSGSCPSSPRLRSRRLHVLGACPSSGGVPASSHRSGRGSGFAVVKASAEPARDFRESMVEMVVENEVRAPEDLLELLELYLSLNSPEHHGVIMEVFRGIWAQITHCH